MEEARVDGKCYDSADLVTAYVESQEEELYCVFTFLSKFFTMRERESTEKECACRER